MKPLRVLWIEDDLQVIDCLGDRLRNDGFVVDVELTGPNGLARALRDVYDVIMLDVELPGMSGLDVLERLRAEHVATPVLVFTGIGTEQIAFQAAHLGAVAYEHKPLRPSVLVAALRRTAAGVTEPATTVVGKGNGGSANPSCMALATESQRSDSPCSMLEAVAQLLDKGRREGNLRQVQRLLVACLGHLGDPKLPMPLFFACASAPCLLMPSCPAPMHAALVAFRSRIGAVTGRLGPRPAKVEAALGRLEASGCACLNLSEQQVADDVGLSPAYLGRLVTLHTGLTLAEWRWVILLRPAVWPLIDGEEQVAQIAYRCGYDDPSRFGRDFHRLFGLAPGEFRDLARVARFPPA